MGGASLVPIHPRPPSSSLWTSLRPDVEIYHNGVPLLLIEVNSSPCHETIEKMAWVVLEQLRWLQNCNLNNQSGVVSAFPNFVATATYVARVDIAWIISGNELS